MSVIMSLGLVFRERVQACAKIMDSRAFLPGQYVTDKKPDQFGRCNFRLSFTYLPYPGIRHRRGSSYKMTVAFCRGITSE